MKPSKEGKDLVSDEKLMSEFQNGNNKAFDEIVRRYKDRLTNFIYRYTGNYDDSDDIVQDTFVRVYTSKHLYKEIAKFSTWIYTIAINIAKTKVIKEKKFNKTSLTVETNDEEWELEISDNSVSPESLADSVLLSRHIQNALNSINEVYRELVILRDIENFSYEEIVEMTGLPMGTVKSRINRGRERLQEILKDIYEGQ
ncbi:MAG: sigma-70 family RNA polymerase sigma factor [Ignavibacteria bacterium]|nr:sigma-70 family RNA polymerase sigma factor [Ignavibacteria bacterium]